MSSIISRVLAVAAAGVLAIGSSDAAVFIVNFRDGASIPAGGGNPANGGVMDTFTGASDPDLDGWRIDGVGGASGHPRTTSYTVSFDSDQQGVGTLTGLSFTFDVVQEGFTTTGTGAATPVSVRDGQVVGVDSTLVGENRDYIDSAALIGADNGGQYEFLRMTIQNLVVNDPGNTLAGQSIQLVGLSNLTIRDIGGAEHTGTINLPGTTDHGTTALATWDGTDVGYREYVDITPNTSVDVIATGDRASIQGFQALFQIGSSAPSSFPLTITPNATTSGSYDFSWDSLDTKVYDLVSSTDLSTAPDTWPVWDGRADIVGTPPTNLLVDVPGGGDVRRFFAVVEKDAPPPPPLFSWDFEADNGGFTVVDHSGGTGTAWEYGDPDSIGEGGSVTTGNEDSTHCWGTGIGNPGFYASGTGTSLISPVIDLTAVPNALLSFAQAIDILNGDTFVVNVIDPDISGVINVLDAAIHTSTPDGDIEAANWTTVDAVPVTGGRAVRLEWRFDGDNDSESPYIGAYIDDVVITEAP